MTPIIKFNKDNLKTSMDSWKVILGLHDWTITSRLCKPIEMILNNCVGECDYNTTLKSAAIHILKPKYYGNRIQKYCAEKILVHELLHCKFSIVDSDDILTDRLIHQLIEDTATSLICSKYDIERSWFNAY